ncbi:MAG TPA: carboxypeptidase regulatory-like domain-containing protein [Candidatus Angelobacter sp.]
MLKRFLCAAILVVSLAAQQPEAGGPIQISGKVVDIVTGEPLSGASIGLGPAGTWRAAVTIMSADDGSFVFPNVAPGRYSLIAGHRGYLTELFDQHDGYSSAIVAGPGLDTSDLVFRLRPESSISGTISDEAGEPIRHAQITLYRTSEFEGRQETRVFQHESTDEEGFYRFRHLRAGSYFISVSAEPWYAQRPLPKFVAAQDEISATPRVYARRVGVGHYAEEQGTSPLDLAYPITFYPGVTEPASATPVQLKSGERFVADIRLQPVPALHLRLAEDKGENSKSFYNVQLRTRLFGAPVQIHASTRSLAHGEMEIVGIAPGHYEAAFSQMDQGKPAGSSLVEIDAVSSGPLHIEQRTSSVSISAVIKVDGDTAPQVQGNLQLINTRIQESISEHFSGADPIEFKQQVRPGTYEVMIGTSTGEFIKSLAATGAVVSGRTIQIKGADPVKLVVTIAHGQGQVTGVALRDGKPLAGVMVVLAPADPAHNNVLFRRDQSDSDGSFTLHAVVPGKYTLLAIEKGWDLEWWSPATLKRYLPGGVAVNVEQNGKYDIKVKVQQAN